MSIIGILSSNLFAAGAAQNTQSSQNNPSKFQQIKTEFQQLGHDLLSGNLTQAQSDFATLAQNLPGASQSTAASTNPAATDKSLILRDSDNDEALANQVVAQLNDLHEKLPDLAIIPAHGRSAYKRFFPSGPLSCVSGVM